ncbi:formylglycine-generating enzyme family protein [Yoonia sp. 2307UL14-13]|uniref:formylglycine-generating enzyme family protein n=1 Tax=Yoonia sp. 2307UL14-13 TaxID=3126506 RepID=UPI0030A5D62A
MAPEKIQVRQWRSPNRVSQSFAGFLSNNRWSERSRKDQKLSYRFAVIVAFLTAFLPGSSLSESAASYSLTDGWSVTPLERFTECTDCPEMIVMPLGSFHMGAKWGESRNPFDFYGENATGTVRGPNEINIIPSEHPRHLVEMDIPYAMARNEVTHAEWMACVDDGGCSYEPDHTVLTFRDGYVPLGPNHPVVNVSYLDALEYVAWLNGVVGANVYRLPSEAEWEYAARAGTTTRFAQGDELTADQANFSRRASENVRQYDRPEGMPELVDRERPVPVEDLDAANAWGVRHMSGNVAEVTMSCWSQKHLALATSSAYLAHAQSEIPCGRRVAKGGGYGTAMDGLRLARRVRPTEDRRREYRGFRVIRQLAQEPISP